MGEAQAGLHRHLGLWQATAINITMVVGAGIFMTVPEMVQKLPGPYALLGWLAAGLLILADGLVWSELAAAFPGSGGSYVYLLECFGKERWGRLMAFLFIWQFLLSGPLEVASGLIALDAQLQALSPSLSEFDKAHQLFEIVLWGKGDDAMIATAGPVRALCLGVGLLCMGLLYRKVEGLGRLALVLVSAVLAGCGWVFIEGIVNFNAARAFDFSGEAATLPDEFASRLNGVMMLAIYNFLGYYTACYLGDEIRDPARNIPRSVMLSSLLVVLLFVAMHLGMLAVVPWQEAAAKKDFNLPYTFMERLHGPVAAKLLTLAVVGSVVAAAFSGMLGYSRIVYGAARSGHFFASFARVHPTHHIPHRALLLVGGLTLACTLLDFKSVVTALITSRLLVQFAAQCVGLIWLRYQRPEGPWPFRMWLYPLPCLIALCGWLFLFASAGGFYIGISLAMLAAGLLAFFAWSVTLRTWPFAA